MSPSRVLSLIAPILWLFPSLAPAERLTVPQPSPKAMVAQTIGLTEVSINYHRPAVGGRKIWGDLVPWNDVWRAGANQNTTITFSTAVTVGGKKLGAGTYGLHMIPGEKSWTVIFSNVASAWGSYSYDAKEDAARISATPQVAPFEERLLFTVDDPTDRAAMVALHWEKLKVPFRVEVDTNAVVAASMRAELRGIASFTWEGWNHGAAWCVANDTNLDEAMRWADRSIGLAERFGNLETKARLLEKKGDVKGAAALRTKAMTVANEEDLNTYAYGLLAKGKADDALAVFEKITKEHPASWNAWDSLGEAQAKQKAGNAQAIDSYNRAMTLTNDPQQKKRIDGILKRLAKP